MWCKKFTIVVPKCDKTGDPHVGSLIQVEVARKMAQEFGGVTTQEAFGGWVDANGKLIEEPVYLVWSYVMPTKLEDMRFFRRWANAYVQEKLQQDAVLSSVEHVEDVLFF